METIILSWMRGTGKSTIWKILSEKLWFSFIDLDKYIEKKVLNLNDYINENWWESFRDLEHKILKEVLNIKWKKVISLWWWTIIFERNFLEINKLKNKKIFFLETDLEKIAERIKKDELNNNKRNSLTWKWILEELEEVYSIREKIYKKNCDYIINNNWELEETINYIFKLNDYE